MSKTWFVTVSNFGNDEDVITIENTIMCEREEGSHYHLNLDNGIQIIFDKPIVKVENEEEL